MHSKTGQTELQRIASALQRAEADNDKAAQIRLYRKLAKVAPKTAAAHAQLAHLLFEEGQPEKAAAHVLDALALPHDMVVDKLVFQHLCKLPAYTAELEQARRWFDQQPNLWRFKLLHEALVQAKRDSEVEPLLLRVLELPLQPAEQSQVLTLLGQRYYQEARFHDAIGAYRLGLELTPDNSTQLFNLGTALEQVGRYPEAVSFYKKVLALTPQNPGIHNNLAMVMLRMGEFEQGWKQYEWRWEASLKEQNQIFSIPRWRGEPLEGKALLVWGEQGIGDHIMFSSMLPDLRRRGGTLHYEIYARLDPLFERSFPPMTFLRRESQGEETQNGTQVFRQSWPKADYQIPMGSLASLFRNDRASFGEGAAYLKPDETLVAEFKAKYAKAFPGKRLIGISWRGGKAVHTERQSRRVSFEDLASLKQLPGVQFIDLQYDSTVEDREALKNAGLDIYRDESVDHTAMMDAPAAQLCALDAVVSVDNTTVHLAGALGVPTYALIQLNPNWRWGMNEGPSQWYGSVQIFRNRELGSWRAVLDRVIEKLTLDGVVSPAVAGVNP